MESDDAYVSRSLSWLCCYFHDAIEARETLKPGPTEAVRILIYTATPLDRTRHPYTLFRLDAHVLLELSKSMTDIGRLAAVSCCVSVERRSASVAKCGCAVKRESDTARAFSLATEPGDQLPVRDPVPCQRHQNASPPRFDARATPKLLRPRRTRYPRRAKTLALRRPRVWRRARLRPGSALRFDPATRGAYGGLDAASARCDPAVADGRAICPRWRLHITEPRGSGSSVTTRRLMKSLMPLTA